jgi:hypothetical protein
MPSRSEGWGGLFKVEQYRLRKERFATIYKVATRLEQTTPALRACPSVLRHYASITETVEQHARKAVVFINKSHEPQRGERIFRRCRGLSAACI